MRSPFIYKYPCTLISLEEQSSLWSMRKLTAFLWSLRWKTSLDTVMICQMAIASLLHLPTTRNLGDGGEGLLGPSHLPFPFESCFTPTACRKPYLDPHGFAQGRYAMRSTLLAQSSDTSTHQNCSPWFQSHSWLLCCVCLLPEMTPSELLGLRS